MPRIIDISPPIGPGLAVFPGDTPFSREILLDMARGDHITLSTIRATVHLGSHADAPCHYGRNGAGVERLPLETYLGPCEVIHVPETRGRRVRVADLMAPVTATRVLLRTDSYPSPDQWNADFAGVEPELVDHLADAGVKLLGIDTPSVDTSDSKDLLAHARCLARDVLIVEGLVLGHVAPGAYEFVGLPLHLTGCDASPIRAVLRAP